MSGYYYYYFVCISGSPDRSTHDGEQHLVYLFNFSSIFVSCFAVAFTICISYKLSLYDVRFFEILAETEIDHKGPNWTFLTLKMIFRVIPNFHILGHDWIHNKKVHDAINLGSTSLLLE